MAGFRAMIDAGIAFVRAEFRLDHAVSEVGEADLVELVRAHEGAIERHVITPAFAAHKRGAVDQFEHVLACIEAEEPLVERRRAILAADPLVPAIDADATDRRDAVGSIWSRMQALRTAFEPVVWSDRDDFWAAFTTVYDRDTAEERLLPALAFADPVHRHPTAFRFRTELGESEETDVPGLLSGISIDYTDEAIRALSRGDRRLHTLVRGQLDDRVSDDGH